MQPVELRQITPETLRPILDLRVSDAQRNFVAANAYSISEAYFYREAWFRGIYAGGEPAGFLMLWDEHLADEPKTPGLYYLWRLMVDARFQGRGIGRAAMGLLVEHVRLRPHADYLLLSHGKGSGNPGPFYQKFGFAYTGKEPEGELEMRLRLSDFAP